MDKLSFFAKELLSKLGQKGERVCCAESCTGGMVAAAMTDMSGSSAWFDRAFITYSNQAKQEMLGVSSRCLKEQGAVSEPTVLEMALGALKHSPADISFAISGIAGPGGGTETKPVGMVCFGWASQTGLLTSTTKHFEGDRHQIRLQATLYAIEGLINHLR